MSSKALRSLMKERQLAKRIQHVFAKYDILGKLTCTLCNGLVVKTEALWPSHLTSKQHRLSLQNQKSQTKPTTDSGPKRKSEYDGSEDVVLEGDSEPHVKRSRLETKSGPESEGEEEEEEGVRSNLPADFFDDPSQRPPPRSPSPEELGEDPEWDAFEATLAAADPVLDDTKSSLFAKASIFVEPVNYDERGVPEDPMAVVEAVDGVEEVVADEEEEEEEDPIEKQIREEKEEIMERIQNEEREQLEADDRVLRMKARVLAFRESRRAKNKPRTSE